MKNTKPVEIWWSERSFKRVNSEVERPDRYMERNGDTLLLHERDFGGGYDTVILVDACKEIDPMDLINGDYFNTTKVDGLRTRLNLVASGFVRK